MKKTLEEQIAELTPEQKSNMKTIYKKYFCCTTCICIIFVIIMIAGFGYFSKEEQKAKAIYDYKVTTIELDNQFKEQLAEINGEMYIGPNSYEVPEVAAAREKYQNMSLAKFGTLVVGGAIGLVSTLAVFCIFKKKYPYFSEKKYKYLKKHNML
ncbi:MAG: hypothetical protein IKW04_01795 [Clostridia bacterium]|nr:hypothetical protein [Clostridia bacterium]